MKLPGLFLGRFQPLHHGHVHALKEIFEKEEKLFIVIGSAQASYTPSNPFSASERFQMIENVLEELDIPCSRYRTIPVPDIHNYPRWVNHVKQFVPPFGTFYTGSDTSARLFQAHGIPVTRISLFEKPLYSGKEIRRRMIADEEWHSLVPQNIANLIDRFDGVERVKSLND
ncbi:MAG: nicotinamide-nucleotide adenylyltransferase [Candidatus Hermodarchaeota archaeon]|nr:nicotinamide-nucleotide adenylyltransferase [Candidatus Hermodarchaeota archaeon]